jgi:chromosome segregation ATPase
MVEKGQGSSEGNSGWVSTDVAAEVLGVSSRSVRNYILNRSLVARKETEGINEKYLISLESLYALRDRRKSQGKLAHNRRASSRSEGVAENTAEVVKETAVDMMRVTLANLEAHIAKNAELRVASAELRARLELSEGAESALREELEGERRRHEEEVERERTGRLDAQERAGQLEQERARLEDERERAQEEARELRAELEAGRSKGFWRRLFGG